MKLMFLCILQMVNAILTRRGTAAPRGERAAALVLDGIKRNDWRARPDAARKLGAVLAERGEIAYWVVTPESDPTSSQRADARERLRLRSAKSLDAALRFRSEYRICDRWLTRLRITLARDVRSPRRGAYRRIGRRGLCESRPALRARRRRAPSRADVCAPS